MAKIQSFIVFAIAAAATIAPRAFAQLRPPPGLADRAKEALATQRGTLAIDGLHEPVEIVRDNWGVPHIHAKNTHDLFFAQGFVAAQDHLWQMELWRRSSEGRLAEVLGADYVARDKLARTLEFHGNWDAEFHRYHPEGPVILAAFADGVNAAIQLALEEVRVPIEFQLMNFRPEPRWTAKILLSRVPALRAMTATNQFGRDLPPQLVELLRNAGRSDWKFTPVALPATAAVAGPALASAPAPAARYRSSEIAALGGEAQVVGGTRSATGFPLLSAAPIDLLQNPASRMFVHLIAPAWNVVGYTEPALPGIVAGHNEAIAWASAPVSDERAQILIVETDPVNANRYRDNETWREMEIERELISVKGKPRLPEVVEIKHTANGVVVWEDRDGHRAYVLRWPGSDVGGASSVGALGVMQAKDAKEFAAAAARLPPAQQWVFADKQGNTGTFVVGRPDARAPELNGKDGFYETSHHLASAVAAGSKLALTDLTRLQTEDFPLASRQATTFEHPLLSEPTASAFAISPTRKSGDAPATSSASSAMFVLDVQDWDRSLALNAPGQSAQPTGAHYADLAPLWIEGKYFPLAFSETKIAEVARDRLTLWPEAEHDSPEPGAAFTRVQTELFTDPTPVTVAFGDYDGDGWVDLFVGYRGGMLKLFRNDHGRFVDVSLAAGITDSEEVRAAAWGDFDGDGHLDLYIGFSLSSGTPNRLYHNDGHGHFVDVAHERGIDDWGETRQVSFVDYDNDGKVDLLVAFREKANRLYHNEGGRFREVSEQVGITGPQSTVGAIWFDYNEDGRLDLFLANQNGALNRVYRNDGDHFTNVAAALGIDGAGRTSELGSVGIAAADFNGDGRIDLFYANYGPSWLLRNDGVGKFTDVAAPMGVSVNRHLVATGWGDYDNDGRPDLYTNGYLSGHPNIRDYLFHNERDHFSDATPAIMFKHDADHGIAWVDYDQDGAVDLVLCDHEKGGVLSVYHNMLPKEKARRSLQVMVLDAQGHYTRAGSEVRLYAAGTRNVLGARLVDTGSGYNSQSALPVHFGLPSPGKVDVEITAMSNQGRKITRIEKVDPAKLAGRPLVVKTNP